MAPESCQGAGAGWGTIEGRSLRIFVVTTEVQRAHAAILGQALDPRHQPEIFTVPRRRWLPALTATRAARALKPDLLHAVGASKTAGTVAAGLRLPLVATVSLEELQGRPRRSALHLARSADALIVRDGPTADHLRASGIERDIYVIADPAMDTTLEVALFRGAMDIVYGRVLGALDGAAISGEPELITLGKGRGIR